ncbi:MAG TPA: hypothetical protein VFE62_26015 [Gemmataceae bacterium]|nr:hypothetical protein [Gemmataceae bacterium]
MTSAKARVMTFGALFLIWLGYLFYLVLHTTDPVIARPQFLIAQAVVVADITGTADAPKADIVVRQVLWVSDPALKLGGKTLLVPDLLGCGKDQGYEGPRSYVLPIVFSGSGNAWQITPIPTPTSYRKPSHGSIDIFKAGPLPAGVVNALVAFANRKPVEATGLLDPILPELNAAEYCVAVFGPAFDWRDEIVPHGILPGRLPIKDAVKLQQELSKLGATVQIIPVEVRIYPDTPQVREQALDAMKLRR